MTPRAVSDSGPPARVALIYINADTRGRAGSRLAGQRNAEQPVMVDIDRLVTRTLVWVILSMLDEAGSYRVNHVEVGD